MTAAPAAAWAAWAGSDASAATPCAPAGAWPPGLTARPSRPAGSNSVTTVLPMAPVAPKTTCQESSGSVIVMLLSPGTHSARAPGRHEFFQRHAGNRDLYSQLPAANAPGGG